MSSGATDYVWIKLATAKEDAPVYMKTEGLLVGQVAALACSSLAWGLTPNKVRLHLVTVSDTEPSKEEIDAALGTTPLSVTMAVPSGT
jgi:hypothetical protein